MKEIFLCLDIKNGFLHSVIAAKPDNTKTEGTSGSTWIN